MGHLTPTEQGRSLLAAARDELLAARLLEREIQPLSSVPGWWAYRAPDQEFGGGAAVNRRLVLMRADAVEKWLGFLPPSRSSISIEIAGG